MHNGAVDVGSPLNSLIPTLDAVVLEVLAGTESGLGATQLARLTRRGTRPGHVRALDRLIRHGLVIAEPTNRGHMYRLNRNHVLIPALTAALGAREQFVLQLVQQVDRLQPAPIHASLFGSFARADGDADSDIDLLLVVEDDEVRNSERWQAQIRVLEDQVLGWTGNRLEALVFSRRTLAEAIRGDEPVITSLRIEGIHLSGTGFRVLADEMDERSP